VAKIKIISINSDTQTPKTQGLWVPKMKNLHIQDVWNGSND
jgi:hypothetical protein